ncbi:MAG: YqgE/AlgH family protein [Pirellula sp.]|jgi:putative transcriptional regulator|nr:YqgE/AlgH family protein [Pirellula sp.]
MNRIPSNNAGSPSQDDASKPERVSLAGCLLAANLDVSDPLFAKGVCLIVEHSDQATVGIMLNRPLAIDPNPFWESLFQGLPSGERTAVDHFNFGGPQNGPIVAIHSDSKLAEGGNSQGIYVSAQVETLQKLATTSPEHLRWFIGHAVWGRSQLEHEIVDGKWFVVPAIPQIVFADEAQMWPEAIRFVGKSVIATFPGVDHFPTSALAN